MFGSILYRDPGIADVGALFIESKSIPVLTCFNPYPKMNNYGKSPFLMGKSAISMAMFNHYVSFTRG
jgi:hypothetical protein